MSMQSYGNCQLEVDIEKLKENKEVSVAFDALQKEIDKSDCEDYEYYQGSEDMDDEMQNALSWLEDRIAHHFNVDVFPQYIDSDAEGTDRKGEVVWCVEPRLTDPVKAVCKDWVSWSTFG